MTATQLDAPSLRARPAAQTDGQSNGLIRLRDVHKTYFLGEMDVPVLKGVTLAIDKGEMVSLTGASGSGKSTLMNILGCLDRPTAGSYLLDGQEVGELDGDGRAMVRNKKIGFVFQSFNLLARTSALDNVMMPLSYTAKHLGDREAMERAVDVLRLVGLGDRMDHHPSQLSGGQQQRVAIARSLVNKPPLLLADEPTGNLDSRTSEEILSMFQRLNEEEGITIIIVTHDRHVAKHTRRQILMRDGLIESGNVSPES
jgi:ABC-type lipoprotein export system ATPase subunit